MANTPINFPDTEARGMWSPPNGAAPQTIPAQWRANPSEEYSTDLPDKTDDELVALGWKKVEMPSYDTKGAAFFKNNYEWNSVTREYDETAITEEQKFAATNYDTFWLLLIDSDVYSTLKTAASSALAANTLLTEFITLINDAKRGFVYKTHIQASITAILAGITLTADELAELQTIFDKTGMNVNYTLS